MCRFGIMVAMAFQIEALDHVQVAMPPNGEVAAETFYRDLLGLRLLPKPASLAARGGRWFAAGGAELHLGVEQDFRPARKAHPALRVRGLDELIARLQASGAVVRHDRQLPGVRRIYTEDPFGNRIELIDAGRSPAAQPGACGD